MSKAIRSTADALAKARELWGKNAGARRHRVKSSPEIRAAARAEYARLNATENKTKEQRLEMARHFAIAMHHQYNVGQSVSGLFFRVEGWGDSWDEAFAMAEGRLQ